jgi:hypothetical protein
MISVRRFDRFPQNPVRPDLGKRCGNGLRNRNASSAPAGELFPLHEFVEVAGLTSARLFLQDEGELAFLEFLEELLP